MAASLYSAMLEVNPALAVFSSASVGSRMVYTGSSPASTPEKLGESLFTPL